MNPTLEDLEYAEKQIDEASRRLESIHERVGEEGVKIISDGTGALAEDGVFSAPEMDMEPEDIADQMGINAKEVNEGIIGIDSDLVSTHIQNVIIDCQLSIELSVKAMFKLVGKDHPFSHGISFNDGKTQGFYSNVPENFERKEDVVRVIFLTQFWEQFYELAKYGAPQLNVRPEMIFRTEDGSNAVEDAEFCIDVAQELLDYVENKHSG